MRRAIDAFLGKIRKDMVALFYFSGYGSEISGKWQSRSARASLEQASIGSEITVGARRWRSAHAACEIGAG